MIRRMPSPSAASLDRDLLPALHRAVHRFIAQRLAASQSLTTHDGRSGATAGASVVGSNGYRFIDRHTVSHRAHVVGHVSRQP